MTTPELEIMGRLLDRLDRLQVSIAQDLALLDGVPSDLATFEGMRPARQSAARATLKTFEQIEDQLSRAFRAIPKLLGQDTARWFGRDHADFMERLGLLDDAGAWSRVVKLRNQLVHDYPLDPHVQFERLLEAVGHLPLLAEAHRRLAMFVRVELPDKVL